MKYGKLLLLFASMSAATMGCNEATENEIENTADSLAAKVETGMNNLGNKVDNINDNDDEDFLEEAVEANTMELKVLNLGQTKGGKDVKTHATHMIADHKKLGDEVMAYIRKKNITLTDVDTAGTDDHLANMKSGKDFDKAFADKMVSDHEKVINLFEDAQDDVKDAELKDMITKTLPKLKAHLQMSKEMQSKLNSNK